MIDLYPKSISEATGTTSTPQATEAQGGGGTSTHARACTERKRRLSLEIKRLLKLFCAFLEELSGFLNRGEWINFQSLHYLKM